jgi:hypothetical protein
VLDQRKTCKHRREQGESPEHIHGKPAFTGGGVPQQERYADQREHKLADQRELHVDNQARRSSRCPQTAAGQQPERGDLAVDPRNRKQAVDGLANPD